MAESHREEIAKLEALYASNPGGRVFVHLAEAYRKAGEHDRARRILTEGLARHSDSASAYVVLGRVLADANEDNEAEAAFDRVLELDAGNLVALRWLGDIARRQGRIEQARERYRELLSRNPNNQEVQDLLAELEAPSQQPAALPPVEPASAAPGRVQPAAAAEPEFGIVQLDDLPGDLGAFAGLTRARSASAEPEPELEPQPAAGELSQDHDALPFEIGEDFASVEPAEFEAQPLEEAPLALESFADATAAVEEPEMAIDVSQLAAPEEPVEEYVADSIDLAGFGEPAAAQTHAAEPWESPDASVGAEGAGVAGGAEADAAPGSVSGEAAPFEEAAPEVELPDFELGTEFPGDSTEDVSAQSLLDPRETQPEVAQPRLTGEPVETAADAAEDAFVSADPLQGAFADDTAASTEPWQEETSSVDAAPLEGVEGGYGGATGGTPPEADEDAGLVTETMAELYRAQGFTDRAVEVYRTLLRRRPNDERLIARLRELEHTLPAQQVESLVEEDESGEVWLRGVGSAWTGTPAGADHATPYTWTEPAEEQHEGEPVGSFLRSLVNWRRASAEEGAAELLLDDAVTEEQAPSAAAPEPAAASPAAEPWTAPQPPITTAQSAEPWQTPAPAAASDTASGAREESEPWATTGGSAPPAPQPRPAAPPAPAAAEPWAQPSSSAPEPWAPVPASATPSAPAASGAGSGAGSRATPVEAAFDEWYSGSGGAQPAAGSSEPTAAAGAETAQTQEQEDEDLAMFRSWLQSLKK